MTDAHDPTTPARGAGQILGSGPAPEEDPQRPRYHFLAPANWMNDPNGFIQWGSTYHLFYQHNPQRAVWGDIHWGHASSEDLVRWRHLPLALAPTPRSPDEAGCWSGCAVDDNGVPTLVYTGDCAGVQLPCLATSDDGLLTWRKHPGNPIIAAPPPGLDLTAFRDHCIWREGETWYQLIGAGLRNVGGTALLYRAPNLYQWEYLHPLCHEVGFETAGLWTGTGWECPDFFPLGERHVLTLAAWDVRPYYSAVVIGDYRDQRFEPLVARKLDYGDTYFYAAQSLLDRRGRRITIGWVPEGRSVAAQESAGWAGAMSLPRELRLGPQGQLLIRPVEELRQLRGSHVHIGQAELAAGELLALPQVAGDSLELELVLEPGDSERCIVSVRRAPGAEEETRIVYDARLGLLSVERERSSLDDETERGPHMAPQLLEPGEPLRLHIFLDRSMLEIFAGDEVTITTRVYPTRADSMGVALLAQGGPAILRSLDAWQLGSIWRDEGVAIVPSS